MENLRNIIVNLKATGPAAVICVWILAVMLLGLYGTSTYASSALSILTVAGGMILITLAQNTAKTK